MVRLNVGPAELRAAVKTLMDDARATLLRAKIDGVLVQRMERGLAEVIIGYRRDPEVGPTILLGIGGIMAELKRSFSVRLAPVRLESAHEMIGEVAELAILRGYRKPATWRYRSIGPRNSRAVAACLYYGHRYRRGRNQSFDRARRRAWGGGGRRSGGAAPTGGAQRWRDSRPADIRQRG